MNIDLSKTSIDFHEFKISEEYIGGKPWPADRSRTDNHIIRVFNTETKAKTSFDFWQRDRKLDELDTLLAFKCLLDEALYYIQAKDKEEFCLEFGYDRFDKEATRAWNGCRGQANKALRVVGNEDRLVELANEISDLEQQHYEEVAS